MANPNIERLLREIVKEQEAEEAYLFGRIDQLEQLCREHEETIDYADQRIYQLEKYAQWYEQEYEPKANERIEQLEQLVKYMYRCYVQGHDWGVWGAPEQQWVEERMDALGLLEVDE